ncbi:MAG: hypothetical protein JNN15_07305 [Blastocatellia bacterium]|nr:hypothetical protein [Blastocatellia bacterium]
MKRTLLIFIFLFTLTFLVSCSSREPVKTTSTQTKQRKSSIDESRPIIKVLRLSEQVHFRMRYFAEESKTTFTSDKQIALFKNVQSTLKPTCQQMKAVIEKSGEFDNRKEAVDMESACSKLYLAFEQEKLEAIKLAIKDFYAVYSKLRFVALGERS